MFPLQLDVLDYALPSYI